MKTNPTEYTPPKHVRWRKIGESVTSHYTNTQRKDVFIDPCECIKKLFDAAKAAVDKVPKQDEVFGGSQRAAAMRTVRGFNRFHAHVKAYEYAKNAEAIYRDTVPGKWRVATEAQIKECGLESESDLALLKFDKNGRPIKTPFKAHIAIPANQLFCESMPATLVFKGTTVLEDWLNNAQQGMDMDSDYYKKVVELGAMIKNATRPVSISGHSLGGGLAAACAHTCGKDAWTFNAAGLHHNTVERYSFKKSVPATIQAYRHEGEVLTAVQEPGWVGKFARIALPIVTLGPLLGNLLSTKLREMPAAPGTKHDLPCIQDDWDSVKRHGMGCTLMSFNTMLREAEDELRQQTGVQCKHPVIV